MLKKQFILFSLLVLSPICYAENDSIEELNARMNRLDELYTQQEVKRILSQLDAIDAQQKKAATPKLPTSSIPVPGQAVSPIPQDYPAPIPGTQTKVPNIFNPPAVNNTGTNPIINTAPTNIYR